MSCAFHNAILSEGTKLFEIPARTTIRSPNHYPLEVLPWTTANCKNLELLKPKCWCYYCKLKPSGLLWLFRASPSWYNAPSMSWVSHMSQVMTGSWSLWTWNPRYSRDSKLQFLKFAPVCPSVQVPCKIRAHPLTEPRWKCGFVCLRLFLEALQRQNWMW